MRSENLLIPIFQYCPLRLWSWILINLSRKIFSLCGRGEQFLSNRDDSFTKGHYPRGGPPSLLLGAIIDLVELLLEHLELGQGKVVLGPAPMAAAGCAASAGQGHHQGQEQGKNCSLESETALSVAKHKSASFLILINK